MAAAATPATAWLGSNKATEETVKLFPKDCDQFVARVAASLKEQTGKNIEVMVYGDGAFKDPVGKIWELADPVVSPGLHPRPGRTPNEVKLKYLADNHFAHLSGDALKDAISAYIPQQGRGPLRADGLPGHHTAPPDRPDRLAGRPDLRLGRQGHPHRFDSGLF